MRYFRIKKLPGGWGGGGGREGEVDFYEKQKTFMLFFFFFELVSQAPNLIYPKQFSCSQGSHILKNSVERNVL